MFEKWVYKSDEPVEKYVKSTNQISLLLYTIYFNIGKYIVQQVLDCQDD